MTNIPYIVSVALLLLVAFLIGCLIGYLLRCVFFKPKGADISNVKEAPAPTAKPEAETKLKAKEPKKNPQTTSSSSSDGKPLALDAPREGKKDDLKRIKGIGPKIEGTLNELGIFHFDQIAAWDRKTVKWVDNYLSFKGRIDREKWVKQAKQLAKGEETEFSKRVDRGAVPSSRKK